MSRSRLSKVGNFVLPSSGRWWALQLLIVWLLGVAYVAVRFFIGGIEIMPAILLLPVAGVGAWSLLMFPLKLLNPMWPKIASMRSSTLVEYIIIGGVIFYWGGIFHVLNATGLFVPSMCLRLISIGWVREPAWLFYTHIGVIVMSPLVYALMKHPFWRSSAAPIRHSCGCTGAHPL